MNETKKGNPVPADLARAYLKDIAAALRGELEKPGTGRAFYRPDSEGFSDNAYQRIDYRAADDALALAAHVLEAVADGERNLGALIDGRGKGVHYELAAQAVLKAIFGAFEAGTPISREEAYRRADDALGRTDSKKLFLAHEKQHGRLPWPTKGSKGEKFLSSTLKKEKG